MSVNWLARLIFQRKKSRYCHHSGVVVDDVVVVVVVVAVVVTYFYFGCSFKRHMSRTSRELSLDRPQIIAVNYIKEMFICGLLNINAIYEGYRFICGLHNIYAIYECMNTRSCISKNERN